MRVINRGEPTVYFVESNSLECIKPECGKLFSRFKRPDLKIGDPCPSCLRHNDSGTLDVRFHQVDIAHFEKNGSCSCEFFTYTLAPKLCRMAPDLQAEGKFRCSHIDAARDFALDVALQNHETKRYSNAGQQREEMQP